MDSSKLSCFLFLAAISLCIASSDAHMFRVGGKHGWNDHPKETYVEWAERRHFAVNDTLFFRYKHEDSVLQVSKEAFDTCNNSAPFWKEDDGKSFFTLNKTGPFYFISGNKEHCDKGQKLFVNVTSGGPPSPPPSHAPSPAPSTEHPGSPSPPPAPSPESSAASDVLGMPAFAVALVGFVFGLIVVF